MIGDRATSRKLPTARREGLIVRELPDETLIYDQQTGRGHCLNGIAAFVWKQCDGATTVAALAEAMRRELGIEQAPAALQLALEQLGRRKLLLEPAPALSPSARLARRAVLKSLAAVAAIPLILTVAANPAQAQLSKHPGSCSCICGPGNGIAYVIAVACNGGRVAICGNEATCTAGRGSPTCECV